MKRSSIILSAFIIAIFSVVSASAQDKPAEPAKPKAEDTKKESPIAGVKWDVVISAPGQDYAGVLKIEKSGDTYKGSVTTELGEAPLAGIKVDGDSFTSTITVNAQGQVIDGTMSGKEKDGKISGEMNLSGLGSIPFTGKKS